MSSFFVRPSVPFFFFFLNNLCVYNAVATGVSSDSNCFTPRSFLVFRSASLVRIVIVFSCWTTTKTTITIIVIRRRRRERITVKPPNNNPLYGNAKNSSLRTIPGAFAMFRDGFRWKPEYRKKTDGLGMRVRGANKQRNRAVQYTCTYEREGVRGQNPTTVMARDGFAKGEED